MSESENQEDFFGEFFEAYLYPYKPQNLSLVKKKK